MSHASSNQPQHHQQPAAARGRKVLMAAWHVHVVVRAGGREVRAELARGARLLQAGRIRAGRAQGEHTRHDAFHRLSVQPSWQTPVKPFPDDTQQYKD